MFQCSVPSRDLPSNPPTCDETTRAVRRHRVIATRSNRRNVSAVHDDGQRTIGRVGRSSITATGTGDGQTAGATPQESRTARRASRATKRPGRQRQRIAVKLGPIGARRVRAGLLFVQQKSENTLFSGASVVFNRSKKRLDIKQCGLVAQRFFAPVSARIEHLFSLRGKRNRPARMRRP
jgi:hypothetical protein